MLTQSPLKYFFKHQFKHRALKATNALIGLVMLSATIAVASLLSGCSGSAATPTTAVPLLITVTNRTDAKANADGTWTLMHDDTIIISCNTDAKKCKWALQTSNASLTSNATEDAYTGTVIATEAAGRITLSVYADNFIKNDLILIVAPGVNASAPTSETTTTCTVAADGNKTCTTTITTCTITSKGNKTCTVTTQPGEALP
jgi:hypothetical protein